MAHAGIEGAPELVRRQRALAYAVEKYRGRAADFRSADCVRMARTLLVRRGHRPPALPRYASQAGALRALKQAGFDDLTALFDSVLPRIAPAAMLSGDIGVMAAPGGIGAAVLYVGNGRVFGWHEDAAEAVMMDAERIDAAWRT